MAEIFDPKPVVKGGFVIEDRILKLAAKAEAACESGFLEIDRTARFNGEKVLKAFIDNRVSEDCMNGSSGYGYGDKGRDVLDAVFAQAMGAEDALVRHTFVSGTHALTCALFGILRAGDTMVSLTGRPYDTLEEVIGLRGSGNGSLADFGVKYDQVDLQPDGTPDVAEIFKKVKGAKCAYIQRSRGYSLRPTLTVDKIAEIIKAAKGSNPDIIVIVDNCYGEFTEKTEPIAAGADLIVGSLIKNPGGGLAHTGGYIAGGKKYVEQCAYRLTCVGMGKEVGCSLNENKAMYQGLFFAPDVVANALKTALFTANIMTMLGFECYPAPTEKRGDIITAVLMKNPDNLTAFIQGIQKGSPVDSFVAPEAWDMPGYDSQVIMAAGAFNNGASIELSADAPLREPYAAYVQGGLTYTTGRMGILLALQEMFDRKCLKLFEL
ncbi:MAG: methionine gamma-lyase family protein [Oscillospiraceae bacterium]|nr:methionine gamma-lyase family protein [Oscillospiraceae bacterium]MDD7429224.1 methionine gamma-lyase family protein [Oscillospiraceae bacterium]